MVRVILILALIVSTFIDMSGKSSDDQLCSSHCCGQRDVKIGLTIASGGLSYAGMFIIYRHTEHRLLTLGSIQCRCRICMLIELTTLYRVCLHLMHGLMVLGIKECLWVSPQVKA